MHIDAWDSVFVRARRADVHPVLADVAGYGRWWPGVRVTAGPAAHIVRFAPPGLLGRAPRRAHAVTVTVTKNRPGLGLTLGYRGDLRGDAEFYYLDEHAGVVVHYLLRAETPDRGWRRRLADHRAVVRAGLNHLKDRLEGARIPGAEPDPGLLQDQQHAIAEFRAGVDLHARQVAALLDQAGDDAAGSGT